VSPETLDSHLFQICVTPHLTGCTTLFRIETSVWKCLQSKLPSAPVLPQLFSVLSSGGFGHVPLPLIKGEIKTSPSPKKYKYDIAFFGNMGNGGRGPILDKISQASRNKKLTFTAAKCKHC
jgi:hypothetical protein